MLGKRVVKIRREASRAASLQRKVREGGAHECAAEEVQRVVGLIESGRAITEPDESEESFRIQVGVSCPHGCTI